jgi:hypothetical protein
VDNVKSLWITAHAKVQLDRKIVQKLLGRAISAVNLFFGALRHPKKFFFGLLPISFESDCAMNIPNIKAARLI